MDNEVKMVVDLLRKSEDKNFRILAEELTLSEKLKIIGDKSAAKVSFILNEASIEFVIKIAKTERSLCELNAIVERLRNEADTEEVKKSLKELSKANSWNVRQFVIEVASRDILIEMVKNEDYVGLVDTIMERLRKETDTEEINRILKELSKSISWRIRMFAAKVAPVDILLEMIKLEDYYYVLDTIIERLSKDAAGIDEEILKELYKHGSWEVRALVAEIAPDDILLEMAKIEDDTHVLDIINSRLVDNYEEGNLIEDIKIAEETNDKELYADLIKKINLVYKIKY